MVVSMSDYNPIKTVRYSGKTIRVEDLPPEAWAVVFGGSGNGGMQDLYSKVSWVFRSIDILMANIGQVPFVIEDLAGNQIDDSKKYENVVGFLPYPAEFFGLLEAALNVFGYGYAYK